MKRAGAILLLLLGVLVTGILALVKPAGRATTWETFERDLPSAVQAAGFRILRISSGSGEQVTPSLGNRLFLRDPNPKMRIGLYPNVTLFLVERDEGHPRIRCLAKYYKGYVGRIAVRYPEQGRQDAVALREALRKAFPNDGITLEQEPLD